LELTTKYKPVRTTVKKAEIVDIVDTLVEISVTDVELTGTGVITEYTTNNNPVNIIIYGKAGRNILRF
jgi:hypothetical protein